MDEEAIASLVMSLSDANLNAERMLPPGIDKLRCGNMIEGTQITDMQQPITDVPVCTKRGDNLCQCKVPCASSVQTKQMVWKDLE